jgi:glycosyltransferase involved in cell wall biosynthesis
MKILVLSNYYPEHVGGVELVAFNLVQKYRQYGHNVHWIAGDVPEFSHKCDAGDIPIRIYNFTENKLGFPYPIPHICEFISLYRQVSWCDVIHLHDCLYLANIIAFCFSRFLKKPLLITQHIGLVPYNQSYKNFLQQLSYRTFGKCILTRAEKTIFVSESVSEWFSRFVNFQQKPAVIPNGVNQEIFHPADNKEKESIKDKLGLTKNSPIILFIGRFTEKKGVHLIKEIINKEPSWFWVLIGRTGDQDPNSWLGNNFLILPPLSQKQLREYYIASDILVLPSTGEGFPLVVQEAIACNTHVLVSEETAFANPLSTSPLLITFRETNQLHFRLKQYLSEQDTTKLTVSGNNIPVFTLDWGSTALKYLEFINKIINRSR